MQCGEWGQQHVGAAAGALAVEAYSGLVVMDDMTVVVKLRDGLFVGGSRGTSRTCVGAKRLVGGWW